VDIEKPNGISPSRPVQPEFEGSRTRVFDATQHNFLKLSADFVNKTPRGASKVQDCSDSVGVDLTYEKQSGS
jgi:hypothetical protein